jgi:hypothetical protein
VISPTIREGDWQSKTDMDCGYWQLGLHEDFKQFVGLHYVQNYGTILFWGYNTLFLGIKSAVWIFTKMLLPLKTLFKIFRDSKNFYIDDVKILAQTERMNLEYKR